MTEVCHASNAKNLTSAIIAACAMVVIPLSPAAPWSVIPFAVGIALLARNYVAYRPVQPLAAG